MMKILLINGWGGLIHALSDLKMALEYYHHQVDVMDYVDVLNPDIRQNMLAKIADYDVIAGWSLGGQVATLLADSFAHQFGESKILWTLFSNPCFVQRDGWQFAQSVEQFEQFKQRFMTQAEKTLQRFLLAMLKEHKEMYPQFAPSQQQYLQQHQSHLVMGLEMLQQVNTVPILQHYTGRQIHFYAQNDHLVPFDMVQQLSAIQAEQAYFDEHFDVYWQAERIALQFSEMVRCLDNKKSVSV